MKQLQQCIVDMVSVQDICLFLTEDGSLYSMGASMKGMLGLGRVTANTSGHAMKIIFPGDARIVDFKVGTHHVLALTEDGQVFSWGANSQGQVGT